MKFMDEVGAEILKNREMRRIRDAAPVLLRGALAVKQSGENSAQNRETKYGDVVIGAAAWDELLAAIKVAIDSD